MTATARLGELASSLVAQGLSLCTGVVGSGASYDLAEALSAAGVDVVPVSLEATATVAAAGAWRASDRPAASLSIKGPGVGAGLAGFAFASMESRPVMTLAEAYGAAAPSGASHKWLDHREILSTMARGFADADPASARMPELVAAAGAPVHPGPVHIDLSSGDRFEVVAADERPAPTADILKLIVGARRPVVIAGALAARRDLGTALASLRIPVFTTAAAKGLIDERTGIAAGPYTGAGGATSPERAVLEECDLVVAVGARPEELLRTPSMTCPWLDLDEVDRASALPAGEGRLVHDWNEVLEPLLEKAWGLELVAGAVARVRDALSQPGWWPGAVVAVLDGVEWDHTLVCDTGSFNTIAEHVWRAGPGRHYESSGVARWMGTAVPLALGWCLGDDRPVICIVGDGGLPPVVSELRVAAASKLPICVVMIRDGTFRSVRPAVPLGPEDMRRQPPADWRRVIEALGIQGITVRSEDEAVQALAEWGRSEPLFLDCLFSPDWELLGFEAVRA